jgi:DNA-binding transcriptional LysR family regulator
MTKAGLPTGDPRFDQQPLLDDPLELLVPGDHRLANRRSVMFRDAATCPGSSTVPAVPAIDWSNGMRDSRFHTRRRA